jgi:uncharacterized membrane protein YdbT with pleckstrin-like domain
MQYIRPCWRSYWAEYLIIILALLTGGATGFLKLSLGFSALILGVIMIKRYRSLYVVSPESLESIKGIIGRSSVEIATSHIRAIAIKQGIIGRILNYGDIELSSAADNDLKVSLKGIGSPFELREQIRMLRIDAKYPVTQ